MLAVAWGFIRSPLGKYLLIAVAVLGLLSFVHQTGYASGVRHELAREAAQEAKAKAEVARLVANATKISAAAQAALDAQQVRVETRTVTLRQKVHVYVTRKADAACVIPTGFVGLWNLAAEGRDPAVSRAAGGPVEAATGLPLSAVLDTTVDDFGVAYGWRTEAMAWRDWYARQKAAWVKP